LFAELDALEWLQHQIAQYTLEDNNKETTAPEAAAAYKSL
jgi:hypothetical protein